MEVFQNISLLHKKSVGLFRGCITRAPDCIEYAESGAHLHCVIKSLYKVLHAWARQFTQNHHSHQKICSQSENRRLFTWREEDPQTRKILKGGSSQRHNVFCIRFTCKGLYLSLALGSSYLRDRKILVLGRSQHHVNCFHQEDPRTRDKPRKNGGGSYCQPHGPKFLHVNQANSCSAFQHLPPSKQPLGFPAIATDEITEASSEKGLTA